MLARKSIVTLFVSIMMLAISGAAVRADAQAPDFASTKALAEQGDASAQFKLGVMYTTGESVPENDAEAVKWYRKAAEQGHTWAQTNLGNMYYNGEGIPENDAEAVKWYRKAAEQGDANGQTNLGTSYGEGEGVPENYIKAYVWLSLGAAQGEELAKKNKDIVAGWMTREQIAEAQSLAATCFANDYKGCD